MNATNNWPFMLLAFAGLAVTTIVTRGSFFMLPARVDLPERVERALRYAPACALTAIVVPGVLTRHGELYLDVNNNQMWAVLAATAVFCKTRNMMFMMAVGMAVFTVLRLYA
jgi:branched-subunit amino acid transport protein